MKLSERFRVAESKIHGKGLFAKISLPKGCFLGTFEGPPAIKNGSHVLWVQIKNGRWRGRSGRNLLRYVNHSATPCAQFDGFDLFALRRIKPDEEITIDYGTDFADYPTIV